MKKFLCTLLAIALLLSMVGLMTPTRVNAQNVECFVYQVQVNGAASDNPFSLNGLFIMYPFYVTDVTENGVNEFEFALSVGRPVVAPQIGNITFASNSAVLGRRAALDMVYMQKVQNPNGGYYWSANPDNNLAATSNNYFNTSNGVTGSIYYAYANENTYFNFAYPDDLSSVNGKIFLMGGSMYWHTATYQAEFSGRLAGKYTGNDCILRAA